MKAILAKNNKDYIGKNGKLLVRSSDDFRHFKAKTMGGILIVGKTTFEVDLDKRMLPGRQTIVVGSGYNTLAEAIELAYEMKYNTVDQEPEIWVIGGKSMYMQLMPIIEEFHISIIDDDQEGDLKFELPEHYRGKVYYYHFKPNEKKEGT
jgi:dihydrofolate reductase